MGHSDSHLAVAEDAVDGEREMSRRETQDVHGAQQPIERASHQRYQDWHAGTSPTKSKVGLPGSVRVRLRRD